MNALDVLFAQLTRDLFAIAKLLFKSLYTGFSVTKLQWSACHYNFISKILTSTAVFVALRGVHT